MKNLKKISILILFVTIVGVSGYFVFSKKGLESALITDYLLVFHWEEKPLAEYMPGNDIEVFDNMLLTLKFFH